jgi:RluA family pseudouridine synthase
MISKREICRSSRVRIVEPYELTRTIRVRPKESGRPLIEFFSERFPYISSDEWTRRILQKRIHQDGRELYPGQLVEPHQIIHHYTPRVTEPSVAGDVEIIRDHPDWLMVYKPAPLPMHQGGRYYKNTLIYILTEMGYQGLHIVHRLDAVTSGLVLLAKNKQTAVKLRKEFDSGHVEKWYYATVKGILKTDMTVEAPIRRKRGFVFECGAGLKNAKPAKTTFEPVAVLGRETVVRCIPHTGRTHQIRLHLRHAGFPITDDPIYGPEGDTSGLRLQNSAIKLQSSGIVIPGQNIQAELPADFLLD